MLVFYFSVVVGRNSQIRLANPFCFFCMQNAWSRLNVGRLGTGPERTMATILRISTASRFAWTEPEPTARARRAGEEFYWTTPEFMFVSFRLLVVESIQPASAPTELF